MHVHYYMYMSEDVIIHIHIIVFFSFFYFLPLRHVVSAAVEECNLLYRNAQLPFHSLPPSHPPQHQSDASGEKLKDLAIEMGLTPTTIAYLKQKVPQKT